MIFDDLKNVTRYKGLHPNLDKAIDYLYEHRKDSFDLRRYEVDGDKVFLLVQENILNQETNDQFEYHKKYADFHLLVAGHEYSVYGSQMVDEAVGLLQPRAALWQTLCERLCKRWARRHHPQGNQLRSRQAIQRGRGLCAD